MRQELEEFEKNSMRQELEEFDLLPINGIYEPTPLHKKIFKNHFIRSHKRDEAENLQKFP